ncbi:type II secretion system F family protein [Candidatus Woesearchaeota archaeon]|nr:type II secretion system F family protein [Candidatus Woesearchaeota archaeon]
MEIRYIITFILFVTLVPVNFILLFGTRWFYTGLILSLALVGLPIFLKFLNDNKKQKLIEIEWLEYIRALVDGVRSGLPITQSIINLKDKDFGYLTEHTRKLANQIEWGIPITNAFLTFAKDTGNRVIKRSVNVLLQAEKSGGEMVEVLESVVNSVVSINILKEERKSSIFSQIVQGYIVFFIFIAIMLVMEVKLVPMIQGMIQGMQGGLSGAGIIEGTGEANVNLNFKRIFLSLIIIQGFFAGLMIGKFSEGSIKYGVKHSVALIVISLLIILTVAPP